VGLVDQRVDLLLGPHQRAVRIVLVARGRVSPLADVNLQAVDPVGDLGPHGLAAGTGAGAAVHADRVGDTVLFPGDWIAPGGPDRGPGDQHPGARDDALPGGIAQADVEVPGALGAEIADRGEPVPDRYRHRLDRAGRPEAGVLLNHLPRQGQLIQGAAQQHVRVRVDEPGQQAGARHLDHRPAVRHGPSHADDHPVLDEHDRAVRPAPGPRVEHPVTGYGNARACGGARHR